MKYLPPDSANKINIPVLVGGEYAIPSGIGTLIVKSEGSYSSGEYEPLFQSEIELELNTPSAAPGEFKIMSVMMTLPTNIGQFKYRENFGVIDLLDIPTTGDDVRNLFGLHASEIRDEEMDLEGKYLSLYPVLINDFHTKRQSNQYLDKLFGELIAVVEAISIAPSLIIRIDKQRTTENGDVKRFGDASNLASLIDFLTGKRDDILSQLSDYIEEETQIATTILQFVPVYNFATGGTT